MDFKPIGSQVVIECVKDRVVGNIMVPGQETLEYMSLVVRAVGSGFWTQSGTRIALEVKPGDNIRLRPSAVGNMVHLEREYVGGRDMRVLDVSHIAGVWEGDPTDEQRQNIAKAQKASLAELEREKAKGSSPIVTAQPMPAQLMGRGKGKLQLIQ